MLTEPGLQAGDHPLFPHVVLSVPFDLQAIHHSRQNCATRRIQCVAAYARALARTMTIMSVIVTAACSRAVAPVPVVVAPPPPAAEPVVVTLPVINSWKIPAAFASTRYITEISATLDRDSVGHQLQEHVQTRALISLQGRRDSLGGLRASGTVDSFTVLGLERALSPSNQSDNATATPLVVVPVLPLTITFDAAIDEHNTRVTTRPPLANECDRAESGATNIVRELLVRIPKTLIVGAKWRDSTAGFMCRLGVPITSRTRAEYVVDRIDKVDDRTEVLVRRTTDTHLDGNVKSTWRTLTITGNGHATQNIRVNAATGVIQGIDGDGVLTVRLNDSARRDGSGTQEVRQTTKSRTIVRP